MLKLRNTTEVIEKFRQEAQKLGGDALIDLQQQPRGAGLSNSKGGIYYSGHVRDIWTAKVIVWQSL